jgi:DinB superfamily
MSDLQAIVFEALAQRYEELGGRVRELAAPLNEEEFWKKPLAFGNSFGHLALHLTGNLNYYIGAQIANTGYVRDRPREFAEAERPSKEEVLKRFGAAVQMVVKTIRVQAESDWDRPYTANGEEDAKNRLTIVLRCLTHLDHHVGQLQYLRFALIE